VLDALDRIDECVVLLQRVRQALEPLDALYPADAFDDS